MFKSVHLQQSCMHARMTIPFDTGPPWPSEHVLYAAMINATPSNRTLRAMVHTHCASRPVSKTSDPPSHASSSTTSLIHSFDSDRGAARGVSVGHASMVGTWSHHLHYHTFTTLYLLAMLAIIYTIDHGHLLYIMYLCTFGLPYHGFINGLTYYWGKLMNVSIAGERGRCAKFRFRFHYIKMLMYLILIITTVAAPPTRSSSGGGSSSSNPSTSALYPHIHKDWDFLPGVRRWDGIPRYDFLLVWFMALGVALGSVMQDGNSLLQCAKGEDEGCPTSGSHGDTEARAKHELRSARVFSAILNYISPTSWVTRVANKEFPNDGPGLYKWLEWFGHLPYDDQKLEEMRTVWEEATMAKVGISFDPDAIWKWHNWVDEYGDRLSKSHAQKRKKFLDGFPESFDIVIQSEKMKSASDTSFKIPTNYPAHHPKSGQHPDRGKPDVMALARHLFAEWSRRCNAGLIKQPPRGSVYQAEADNHDDDDDHPHHTSDDDDEKAYGMSRNRITERTICGICGGRGHAGSVDGSECLTKQLNINIPRRELAKTRYPDGMSYPFSDDRRMSSRRDDRRSPKHKSESSHAASSSKSYRSHSSSHRSDRKTPHRRRHEKTRTKHVRHVDATTDEHTEPESTYEHSESDASSAISSEHVGKLAVNFTNIDTRGYRSYSESDESTPPPSSRNRSATTSKAKKR